ncbi:uncharacterized protein LOC125670386 [Ostrea edulis]|uniref:uncharacterized protein LOC125670386 n=1 Tax=Ostrea edulis TaxID=37623 RepID=UPI0024AF8EB4|nr:uncharacterized protein LOC125670386 [Ostrea edulis]
MFHYFLVFLSVGLSVRAQSCHFSNDCPQTATCCRNKVGEPLLHSSGFGHFDGALLTDRSGQCSSRLSREHETCDSHVCPCGPGLECYTPMSGVCCPQAHCYNATWVQQQKEYWRNCMSNPGCALPP